MNFFLLTLLSALIAQALPSQETFQKDIPTLMQATSIPLDEGLLLLQKRCYTCHNPNSASHDDMLAPPLMGIKNHYRNAFSEKEKFITAMEAFVTTPSVEKALMKGPIKRFGLMPKPVVSPEEIRIIVKYIEANDLEKPKWYDEHHGK